MPNTVRRRCRQAVPADVADLYGMPPLGVETILWSVVRCARYVAVERLFGSTEKNMQFIRTFLLGREERGRVTSE